MVPGGSHNAGDDMKVPTPEKMSSGNWYIRMRLGGESISIIEPTKAACVQRAQLIKAEYKAGLRETKVQAPTLSAAIDAYIAERSNVLSPATIRGYRIIQRNRFQMIQNIPLTGVQSWQAVINTEARNCSAKTLKNAWGLVMSVLKASGLPTPAVKLPQVIKNARPWLTPEELPLFLRAIEGRAIEIPALLELHGLRRSEMLALTWDSIDLDKELIKVSGSVVPNESQKLIRRAENKTQASNRIVPIMIPALREALEAATEKAGALVSQHPDTVRKGINRACRAAGLPEVGNHGLRYSFASLAYDLGWSERDIMETGGWSDYQTMHKIYIRLSQRSKDKAAGKMKEFFKNAK